MRFSKRDTGKKSRIIKISSFNPEVFPGFYLCLWILYSGCPTNGLREIGGESSSWCILFSPVGSSLVLAIELKECIFQAPKIVSARYLELCTPHHFDYLLWITILEAILLLLVCSKLIYDIVQYRRTGQLPWLARMLCIGCSHSNSKSHYTRNQERRKSSFWGCGAFRRSSQQTLSLESSEPGRRFTLDAFRLVVDFKYFKVLHELWEWAL